MSKPHEPPHCPQLLARHCPTTPYLRSTYISTSPITLFREGSVIISVRNSNLGLCFFAFKCCVSQALCGPNGQKFGELLTWPKVITPSKFLPNLSTESWETQHLKAKKYKPKFEFRTLFMDCGTERFLTASGVTGRGRTFFLLTFLT